MRAKKPSAKRGRTPTYGAAMRIARLICRLHREPRGASIDSVCRELSISERTLMRYLRACREDLVDDYGRPLLEIAQSGERRMIRFASRPAFDSAVWPLAALDLLIASARSLDGTVVMACVETLRERILQSIPHEQRTKLADFDRKIRSVGAGSTSYTAHDDQIDAILGAVVRQHKVAADVVGPAGELTRHTLDPYTLATEGDRLLLIGRVDDGRIVRIAVDDIKAVEPIRKDGAIEGFAYPRDYDPDAVPRRSDVAASLAEISGEFETVRRRPPRPAVRAPSHTRRPATA